MLGRWIEPQADLCRPLPGQLEHRGFRHRQGFEVCVQDQLSSVQLLCLMLGIRHEYLCLEYRREKQLAE